MAGQLTGTIEVLRVYELLEKILAQNELANYSVLIDNEADADSKRIPLDKLRDIMVSTGFWNDRGGYNASSNLFPAIGGSGTNGSVLRANTYRITTGGTLGGMEVTPGMILFSEIDLPGQIVANWSILGGSGGGGDYLLLDQVVEQTVINGAPTFDVGIGVGITNDNPTYKEGLSFYDKTKKAISYYNDIADITVNNGQELLTPIWNNTGSTITNGKVVTPNDELNGLITVVLADNSDKAKSRSILVATHDIPNNSRGYATNMGSVGGLDTSGFVSGILYLGSNGLMTQTRPTDGKFEVIIGHVGKIHATDGNIIVNPMVSPLTVEVNDTNGFPESQRTNTTINFVDGTRTFSIAPIIGNSHYYQEGEKFEKSAGEGIVIPNTTGGHILYYDNASLQVLTNGTDAQISTIILSKCIVAYVYWNATAGKSIIFADERHGISMSATTHLYLHKTVGARYLSGLTPGNYIVDGNGSLASHAQFGISLGQITDEDLPTNLLESVSTGVQTHLYKEGALGIWNKGTVSGFAFPVGVNSRPMFNEWTGSIWQLTQITSTNFMCIHVFASSDMSKLPFFVLGTAQYTSKALATAGASNEVANILPGLPAPEFVLLHTFILESRDSYTNAVNARYVTNNDGNPYINWLITKFGAGATPSNHNNLSGLQLAGLGVTWGHIDNANQSIYGQKTFVTNGLIADVTATEGLRVSDLATNSMNINFGVNLAGAYAWIQTQKLGTGAGQKNLVLNLLGGNVNSVGYLSVGKGVNYQPLAALEVAGGNTKSLIFTNSATEATHQAYIGTTGVGVDMVMSFGTRNANSEYEKTLSIKNGNVGISTNTYGRKLEIGTENGVIDGMRITYTPNSTTEGLDITYLNSTGDINFDSLYNGNVGNINFRTKTQGTPINALSIKYNGYVGINTVNPSEKLEVNGNIKAIDFIIV